jgi:class 3 adenylate cyclase
MSATHSESLQVERETRRVELLLNSEDDRHVKSGVQAICELLEEHAQIQRVHHERLRRALSRHLDSKDMYVRRWIYKAIALLGDQAYAVYLRSQLANVDSVAENRSWAIAALARVSLDFKNDLKLVDEEWTLPFRLSASMYCRTRHISRYVREASRTDDPLAHQWVGLLHGDGRAQVPLAFLKELTASDHPEVAEYAIWGLRRGRGSLDDVALGPHDLDRAPENVRRWYYRIFVKDERNLERYASLIEDWISSEGDSKAREGLARALTEVPFSPYWHDVLTGWQSEERDPYVRVTLARYFDQLALPMVGEGFKSQPKQFEPRLDSEQKGIPRVNRDDGFRISDTRQVSTYTLVVDVESFSTRTDEGQLSMFEQLLGVLRRRRDAKSATCLLVGDGAIIVWTDPAVGLAPVEIATELHDAWSEVQMPRVRLGIHSGTAYEIVLGDGRLQYIGDAINKAVRCCSVAVPGELLVSEEYYQMVVKSQSGRLRERNWIEDQVEIKHGETIRVRRLQISEL